ncbi:efflux RND transporter periplasmic adaptor subunit [Phycisphaerales bacterium AB-hyl4]|uniref:Efflux RND transporter periplasmic adaptor subunit n=1 Tax=Natronomicrosphaera hydrolytica TaxID=3242702 RepID=A0ABV4U6R2_9BACT
MTTPTAADNRRKVRRWLFAGGLALAFIASFVVGRLTSPGADGPHDHDADVHTTNDVTDAGQTYYCSMHPEVRSDDPNDTCPICGMDLIPMPDNAGDEDDGDLPILRLSERSLRLLEVQTTPVERRAAEKTIHFVGQLDYDETRVTDLVARSDSYVHRLHANYPWKPVERGDVIAELDSPAITAAARELRLVHRGDQGPRSQSALDAARARLERFGLTADQIDRIIDADDLPRTYELRSPLTGVIAELDAREGDRLADGDRLVRIVDLTSLWLQLQAYESDLPWLEVEQSAEFTVPTAPGETHDGTVAFIAPVIDDNTRTARVRLNVDNPQGQLRPGMFARGKVHAQAHHTDNPPLLIPASAALITGRDAALVYVRQPDTDRPTFEGRRITLGPRVNAHYIVRDGLEENEHVVTHGAFKIDSELQIRGRPSMMARAELFREQPAVELTALDLDADLPDDVIPYPLDVCLVTDLPLDSMGGPVRFIHEDREIKFCCDGCIPPFEADPDAYLPKLDDTQHEDAHNH